MKVIISHDVDHVTVWEHKKDLIIPKFIIRNFLELIFNKISIIEYFRRYKAFLKNKWDNIHELLEFNKKNNIPATFFIGVSNGRYLNYSLKNAEIWIRRIMAEGFDVGVHGIAYDKLNEMKKEHETFRRLSHLQNFGIRMHYLMNTENTVKYLNEAGYLFDSTMYEKKNPYRVGKMWEFPLHIMDGYILCENSRWQNRNLEQAKEATKKIIEEALSKNINYLTILFHDRYFNDAFKTWKDWYVWVISYLKGNGFKFVNYRQAIKEITVLLETR